MPTQALENYLIAHVILGRLKLDLPTRTPADDVELALVHCAELLYSINRYDESGLLIGP
jgi:hypothetical protein